MRRRQLNIILIMALIIVCITDKPVAASPLQEIRVGLTSLFSGKNEIKVNNTKLSFGYVKDRVFTPEVNLTSETGFIFRPATGYYVSVGEKCAGYGEVFSRLGKYKAEDRSVLCVVYGPGEWGIYVGGYKSYTEAAEIQNRLISEGATNAVVLGENEYRLTMSWGATNIIIDVDDDMEYPQFEALSKYENSGYFIDLGERVYRGRIEIGRYRKSTLTAVNVIPVEEYLYGVVSSEMPDSWPLEALKAQAVCSRSYALVKGGLGGTSDAKKGYKITDTTDFQVYRGALYENPNAVKAVDMTNGELVGFKNKAIAAYYFSSGGGSTESSEEVWGFELPYLSAMSDSWEGKFATEPWKIGYTFGELTRLLEDYSAIGPISDINVLNTSQSGRVSLLRVTGLHGSMAMQTTSIRIVLGLKGTKFTVVKAGDTPDSVAVRSASGEGEIRIGGCFARSASGTDTVRGENGQYIVKSSTNMTGFGAEAPESTDEVYIYGLGSGHGVGMSQTGAAGMAEKGFTYKEIIEYYFKGCKVL